MTPGLTRITASVYVNIEQSRGFVEVHKSHPDYQALREKLKGHKFIECDLGLVRSVPKTKVEILLNRLSKILD